MPYYVYRITQVGPIRQLESIADHALYRDAAAQVRMLRKDSDPALGHFRLIFAENQLQAEELLLEVRPPEPMVGDDY